MKHFRAIIFDIDGTLTPGNSWAAFSNDLGASVSRHMEIYRAHAGGKLGLDESKQLLLQMWQKTGNANRDHIEKRFDTWPIRPEALPLINWLKSHDYIVCLITGSVENYASHIAAKLGVEHWYANAELFFDWRGEMVAFHYTANQAEVKLEQFADFCKKHNLSADQCIAIGDGPNDIGLFEVTGNGVLVEGERLADGHDNDVPEDLRSAAWKTVASLDEIPGLLS